jgi:hypothetical protein
MTFSNKYRMRSQQLTVEDWSKTRGAKEEHNAGPDWNTGTVPAKLQHSQSVFSLVLKSALKTNLPVPDVCYVSVVIQERSLCFCSFHKSFVKQDRACCHSWSRMSHPEERAARSLILCDIFTTLGKLPNVM